MPNMLPCSTRHSQKDPGERFSLGPVRLQLCLVPSDDQDLGPGRAPHRQHTEPDTVTE